MKSSYNNFKASFFNNDGKKQKGLISCYLGIYFSQLVAEMISQHYTERMIYTAILNMDESLRCALKFNTFRSWIRKKFKKGRIEAQYNGNKVNWNENSTEDQTEVKQIVRNQVHSSSTLFTSTRPSSQTNNLSERDKYIPRPLLPIRLADKTLLMEIFGYDLDNFYIDANGILFDGYSSDKENDLVPIPCQFQILPQQDGIKKHYFIYLNENVDSKNLLNFLISKYRNGTLSFTYFKF